MAGKVKEFVYYYGFAVLAVACAGLVLWSHHGLTSKETFIKYGQARKCCDAVCGQNNLSGCRKFNANWVECFADDTEKPGFTRIQVKLTKERCQEMAEQQLKKDGGLKI